MSMSIKAKSLAGSGLFCVLALSAACSRPRATHLTVGDLMEDRVTRDGILMKCNRNPATSDSDVDCLNARIAIERIAAQREKEEAAAREAQFERRREQLRLAEDAQRQAQEAARRVDPYSMPVVPVTPTPTPAPPGRDASAAQNP
jgi:hypothetical protein